MWDALHEFFGRALKIKQKKSVITLIRDSKGKETINANDMAKAMSSHLSQIIGQEEDLSKEMMEAQDIVFSHY